MLTKADVDLNLRALELLSRYQLQPFQFNSEDCQMRPEPKIWLCKLRFCFLALNVGLKLARLFQSLIFPEEYFKVDGFIFHVVYTVATLFLLFCNYTLIKERVTISHLFNSMHAVMPAGGLTKGFWKTLWFSLKSGRGHSSLEQYIIALPINTCSVGLIFCVVSLWERHQSLWYYSFLPLHCQNPLTLTLCTALDTWLITEVSIQIFLALYLVASYVVPHLCQNTLDPLQEQVSHKSYTKFLPPIKALKKVWLEMKIFNEVASTLMYLWKLMALFDSIFGLLFGIKFCRKTPFLAIIVCVIGVDAVTYFSLLFGHAYLPTERMKLIKLRLGEKLKRPTTTVPLWAKGYIKKELKAIPNYCLKAGGFYHFDRLTVPTFVAFVFGQVADLLVTFK